MPGIESMSKSKSSSLHVVGERPRAWLGDETVAVSDARGARVSTEANGFLVDLPDTDEVVRVPSATLSEGGASATLSEGGASATLSEGGASKGTTVPSTGLVHPVGDWADANECGMRLSAQQVWPLADVAGSHEALGSVSRGVSVPAARLVLENATGAAGAETDAMGGEPASTATGALA
eukprot:scaffold159502_cov33-Tisochrysis_lutea.AAC.4